MRRNRFGGLLLGACFLVSIGVGPAFGQYKKMLVVGNSITRHAPSAGLFWSGDWGMAASSRANDYVHQLKSKIEADQPGAPLELQIGRITDENNTMSGYGHFVDHNADLVVIQLGDNYSGPDTEADLQVPFEQLIQDITAWGNNPEVIVLSTFTKRDNPTDPFIQQAAINQGATFVDINFMATKPDYRVTSESYVLDGWKNSAVGFHPGDLGMEVIAQTIYEKISENAP